MPYLTLYSNDMVCAGRRLIFRVYSNDMVYAGRRLIFRGCIWLGRMCFLVDLPGPSSPAYSPLRYCSSGAKGWYSWVGCALLWVCRTLFSGLLTAQVLFQRGRKLIFLGCIWLGRMCSPVCLLGPSSPAYSLLRYCSNGAEDLYSGSGSVLVTNRSGCGSARPKTYGSESGSATLL